MIGFFIFLTSIPVLGALGHDLWLFYEHQDKGFELSALGYIWTRYHPESYNATINAISPELWTKFNEILTLKALHVALVPFIFFVILGFIQKFYNSVKKSQQSAKAAAKRWTPKNAPK